MADEAIKRRKTEGTNQQSKDVEPQRDWFIQRRLPDDLSLKFDDGKELFASRSLLMCASPYFEAMFTHNMKEKENNVVNMPGKNYDHFLELLECLHPRIVKPVTHENVYYLADLVDYYGMKGLFSRCRDAFIKIIRQTGTLCEEGPQLRTSDTQEWLEAKNSKKSKYRIHLNNVQSANHILKILSIVAKFKDELLNTEASNLLSCIPAFDYDNIIYGFTCLCEADRMTIQKNKAMFDELDADLRAKISSARLKRIDIYEV